MPRLISDRRKTFELPFYSRIRRVACVPVLDKDGVAARKGVIMIDASKGTMKVGNKNRFRERDIHRIVNGFADAEEHPGYELIEMVWGIHVPPPASAHAGDGE